MCALTTATMSVAVAAASLSPRCRPTLVVVVVVSRRGESMPEIASTAAQRCLRTCSFANRAAFRSGISSGCGYPLVIHHITSFSLKRCIVGYGLRIAKSFAASSSLNISAYRFFLLRRVEQDDLHGLLQPGLHDDGLQSPRSNVQVSKFS